MKNLLVIDDEELLLNNMKIMLSSYASSIFTAKNGKEGLSVLDAQEIHCVICDITMPVMNGVEFIKEVRARNNEVPIIFYSAYGSHSMMMEVSKYGAFDFLRKPDFEDLENVVTRGLAEGFNRRHGKERVPGDFISEYQELLEKIKNHKE
ncbi:MAG TPA: response regulator [Bacteriovoracaceae bacterium]|nr:response regulator [Bacteriovoracaceae bacterium]